MLAWDISLSKICVTNCVCGRFLAERFTRCRTDHMIYLILSHFLEVLFPFCYANSTFSAAPHMLSSTMMKGKVMSSEMTDVDRPFKTSALPVSASSLEKDVLKNRIGHSLDSRVYG